MATLSKVGQFLRFVAHDFIDFVLNQKKWWLTALLVTLAFFLGMIVLTEPKGARPIVYDSQF